MSVCIASHKVITDIIQILSYTTMTELCIDVDTFYMDEFSIISPCNGYEKENQLGKKLLEMNVQSYMTRYPNDNNQAELQIHIDSYNFEKNKRVYAEDRFVLAYKKIAYWKYQSCEVEDYDKSKLWKGMIRLQEEIAFHIISNLPGGNVWGG